MEAFAIPAATDRLDDAVDGLVDESIDEFSTHALGEDLIDIRRAIDRLEAEFSAACIALIAPMERSPLAG